LTINDTTSFFHRIALSNPFQDTLSTGSQSWVVKDIDLYTTTVVLGATNEVSTISNGSLAGLRIINCARSPKASLSTLLKFPIDVSYTKLQVFKSAVEKFIKARPREVRTSHIS
jgi:small-conductance mechanosensitive channel